MIVCLNYTFEVVCNTHRSGYVYFENALETTLNDIMPTVDESFCFGDLNIVLLSTSTVATIVLLDVFESYALVQVIDKPIRVSKNWINLIDLVVTTNCNLIREVAIAYMIVMSDHA